MRVKPEKNYGYFALISNGIKNLVEALRIYRLKDLIEKSFGNFKERLSMRRMSVASEENFEGKLFVQLVGLQMVFYIKKQMDKRAYSKTTQFIHYLMNWIPFSTTNNQVRLIICSR